MCNLTISDGFNFAIGFALGSIAFALMFVVILYGAYFVRTVLFD